MLVESIGDVLHVRLPFTLCYAEASVRCLHVEAHVVVGAAGKVAHVVDFQLEILVRPAAGGEASEVGVRTYRTDIAVTNEAITS